MHEIKQHVTCGGKVNIFFITGTSGSGKSTLVKLLKGRLSKTLFEVYDFDENGVPSDADESWRRKNTDYWLVKAQENAVQKKSTIICGVTVPSEILSSLKKPDLPIYFGFIKIADETIRQRLKARKWDARLIQDNINWAHYLEAEVRRQKYSLIVESPLNATPEHTSSEFIKLINSRLLNENMR